MTTTTSTSLPSLDDIVFEGRNKAYGAYVLRKVYGRHIGTAVTIATALAALLIAVPLLVQRLWPAVVVVPPIASDDKIIQVMADPTIKLQPSTPPPAAAVTVRPTTAPTPTRVVRDELVKTPDPTTEVVSSPVDGPAIEGPIAIAGDGDALVPGSVGGKDTSAKPAAPAVTEPFVHVENMPEFIGGTAALTKYLQRQLHYPSQALRAGVEGKVYISFVVNTDGSITDVTVLKGLGYGTDEEASRVIRQMPAWKPGYQNHHAVPVRYTLPITFQYE